MNIKQNEPLIIAHRGGKGPAPENTIEACRLALKRGANALEVDIRLCGSGELVLLHDRSLKRHFGQSKLVCRTGWDEIKKLEFNQQAYSTPGRVTTLDHFLEEFGKKVTLILDLKNFCNSSIKLANTFVDELKRFQLFSEIWVSAFNPLILALLKKKNPQIRTGYLFRNFVPVHRGIDVFLQSDAWHPHYSLINERLVRAARKAGKELYVWTINEESVLKKMEPFHFEGIITDRLF